MDGFSTMDRPPDGRVWTTDRDYLKMDGRRIRTVHLMDGFGRRTIKILKMWTDGQMEENPSVEAWFGHM